jgi:hypothetical protein
MMTFLVDKNPFGGGGSRLSPVLTSTYDPKFFHLHPCNPPQGCYNTGMKDQMTFEEFASQLPYLDWYYMMSDDGAAYRRGRDTIAHYRSIAEENGPEWVEAFQAEKKKHRI